MGKLTNRTESYERHENNKTEANEIEREREIPGK